MSGERGSVLMEYVLLLLLLGVVLIEFSATIWTPDKGWGTLGEHFVGWAHRLASVIALPLA